MAGVESMTWSPAQCPDCSLLGDSIFIKLCNIYKRTAYNPTVKKKWNAVSVTTPATRTLATTAIMGTDTVS